ncbi:PAS domain S-box-containing protein/diguanylate cyclase (GGDEF) domain-containing protein [Abditibacterium utsteinense]|uniref:PAS domain S-box-containing protein/diguanylate cyclase (GGDEF) domain-containing protein n=1 Tax=Abditibacterium utsteinense TaxID=1960156 RepID=A0A2S8SQJ4_9BACT|nr:PAS domain-containing protein [Abditibacterium utsteinense]PQV63056.1 PAS domain S-box-containing protein/diguanylate cyclase (GGDEF) domain-containing protein [Abditibacterium utsteinense]
MRIAPTSLSLAGDSLFASSSAAGAVDSQTAQPQTVATRVLLVDDDEDEWIIARDLLLEVQTTGESTGGDSAIAPGFDLEWISNYEAGLEAIACAAHDVYLIDYHLGGRSGLDLVREAVARGAKAPLILMTGQGDGGIDIEAMRAGAADYLVKNGLSASVLERAIRYAIAQKSAQEALRESAAKNQLLSAAVENANIGVLVTSLRQGKDGQTQRIVTFVNPAFEQITGYSRSEVIGRDPRILRGAGTDPQVAASIEAAVKAGVAFDGVLLHYRKDGTAFWDALKLAPVRGSSGKIIAWISFLSDISPQIEDRQALRESRENLEAAQKMTHLGSWMADLEGAPQNQNLSGQSPVMWSDEVFRILGLEPQSVSPSRALDLSLVHPDDLEIASALEAVVEAGTMYDAEYRVRRPGGEGRWVRVRAAMERNELGAPRRIVGTILDITERKEAEERARESQWRLQSVIENAPIIIWSLDAQGTITFIGGHILESSGTPNRGNYGNSIFELNEASSPMASLARQALAGQEASEVLLVNERFFDTKYVPLRDEKGEVSGAIGVAFDISERRHAEIAFGESEARMRAVLENSQLVIWALDLDGIFILSRGRALKNIGLEQDENVGRSVFDVYGEKSPIGQMARRALSGEASHIAMEVQGRIFDVNYSPTHDQNGAINGVIGVAHDITERVRARHDLEQSEARFTRVVANAPGMVYQFRRTRLGQMEFLYASDGCRDIFGIEPEELCFNSAILPEMMHEDDLGNFYQSVFESENELSPWEFECRIWRRDGQMRWIRAQARPARDADGATFWDGLVVDITQNRQVQSEILRSRRALDEAQSLAHIGSLQWDLANGHVEFSDEMFRIFGHEPGDFTPNHETIFRFFEPAERDHVIRESRAAMRDDRPASMVIRIQRRDGETRVLQTDLRIETDDNGRATYIIGSAQDITESEASRRALFESEQRYALAAQGANDGLWDWDLESGQVYYSPRWKMMLGYAPDAIQSEPEAWLGRVHADDIEHLRVALAQHLNGETPHFECEYRIVCASGEVRWMLCRALAVMGENGKAHRIAGSQTDITERKVAEAQLSRDAFYDKLTGLPNRALFLDRLNRTLTRARRNEEYTFAVLFLDIDRFKKINDSLGHLPGDQLLIDAAARFENCLRPGDTVARLGGDEFALLVDDIHHPHDVTIVAGRIQKELERPFILGGKEVFVTVSIGIAPFQGADEAADDLLRNADAAMYRAKGLGRARHEIFDSAMHQRAMKLLELETDLWRAVERRELCLHYQPIVSLQSGQICGFEALVRWQHPQRGLISPADFIPLAEENGLILPIGWWVLEEACAQAKSWHQSLATKNEGALENPAQKALFISVNLSSKQFSQPDMIERVQEIMQRTGFDPHFLTLEITESVIMENTESASAMLLQLKAMGIHLSMDDFGTGYSSLSYLHRFSLDTLKIDRSFISPMGSGQQSGEIVNTILALASGMNMKVVAEGVETSEQLGRLRAMKCGYAQGFLFAKPLTREQVEALLATEPRW